MRIAYQTFVSGVQLNSAIDETSGNHFNKYLLTEEDCYKKCQSERHCLAMSYNRGGAETDELCQLYYELVTLFGTQNGQSELNWDTWIPQNLQSRLPLT